MLPQLLSFPLYVQKDGIRVLRKHDGEAVANSRCVTSAAVVISLFEREAWRVPPIGLGSLGFVI